MLVPWLTQTEPRDLYTPINLAVSIEEVKKDILFVRENVVELNDHLAILEARLAEMAEVRGLLQQAAEELRSELAAKALVSTAIIGDVGDSRFEVIVPISAVLEEREEESLATWPEIRASGIGGTAPEAISNLKLEIVESVFRPARTGPEESWGNCFYTFAELRSHLRKKQ